MPDDVRDELASRPSVEEVIARARDRVNATGTRLNPLELYPSAAVADRAWQLRDNLTTYDAAYVALAELFAVPLVTLDARLARATGPRCAILCYPESV